MRLLGIYFSGDLFTVLWEALWLDSNKSIDPHDMSPVVSVADSRASRHGWCAGSNPGAGHYESQTTLPWLDSIVREKLHTKHWIDGARTQPGESLHEGKVNIRYSAERLDDRSR